MDFYLLLKIWVKNIGENISNNLSGKYSQNLLDPTKPPAADELKLLKLKISNKIKKVSRISLLNSLDKLECTIENSRLYRLYREM